MVLLDFFFVKTSRKQQSSSWNPLSFVFVSFVAFKSGNKIQKGVKWRYLPFQDNKGEKKASDNVHRSVEESSE